MNTDFKYHFYGNAEQGNLRSAYRIMMNELGKTFVTDRKSFVDLLNESGVEASINDAPDILVQKYVDNICQNKKLMLGSSLLLQMKNKTVGFDGEERIDDEGVKLGYFVMRDYLGFDGTVVYSYLDDIPGISTAAGAASGGPVGAIAGAVSDLAKLGTKGLEGSQRKKYGAQDIYLKQQETKTAIIQAAMQQKAMQQAAEKKKQEAEAKTNKTILLVTGGVVLLGVVALVIYKLKEK